ncbi:MAG: primosomal protein N' [Candidatus Melainabacteria bacterium RIFCSPLOWO2_02_FULL_35_15]|nr:MAG: primosomal protein N' [Candidatus Melainabacteria bacterium RIFCSPLOWO2_12_FULL_35_11]OGI12813.1 MAG: primosomal protein N' [Candidatus Melainabacteria bacterium RIFCSPLOWO2_02_FULL_35_15]
MIFAMPDSQTSLLETEIVEKKDNSLCAKVAIDLPICPGNAYYYSIPEEIKKEIKIGSAVYVSFGRQELIGFVIEIGTKADLKIKNDFEIKSIYYAINNDHIWDEKFLDFAKWISRYYLTNIGTVLSASLITEFFNRTKHELELNISKEEIKKLTNLTGEQKLILEKFLNSKRNSLSYQYLLKKTELNKEVFYEAINKLKSKKILKNRTQSLKIEVQRLGEKALNSKIILNKEQEHAYNTILSSLQSNNQPSLFSKTFLIHGVTGSGKTEIYLNLIEDVLKTNKSAIYLVPEIYLVPQVLQRLVNRFGSSKIIIWHSFLNKKEKINNWKKILQDSADLKSGKIILGARSAILVPLKNIGLIIIDEAHEAAYKQASPAPRYDTIKVAVKRSELENCPVVLGTATPNISDYFRCLEEHTVLKLTKRIENYPMPKVHIVDLKNEFPVTNKNIISNVLKSSINEALSKKEQIILLLNRRGYSSHIFCRTCGFIQKCKNCSVPLVYHKNLNSMLCHHCGYELMTSQTCPECKSPHFKYFGLGTQQLEEDVKKIFSSAKTIRVDKDQLRKKDQYLNLWQEFSSGRADILIGTQLVAKGLDLPNVTVVGVIIADTMLNFPDYVSYERAFQLLTQVTGRTGRGNKPGRVFIQTYQSETPIFKYVENHDFESFYNTEIEQRKIFEYPPFTNLSRIIFQSKDEKLCLDFANQMLKEFSDATVPQQPITFLGPAPCFFTKLHGKYRYHILCKTKHIESRNQLFNKLLSLLNKNAKVDIIIDIDSVNLL